MSNHFYVLVTETDACDVLLQVNGFPAWFVESPGVRNFQIPVNHCLIGRNNVAAFEVRSTTLFSGLASKPGDVRFKGYVKQFQEGDRVEPGTGTILHQWTFNLDDYEKDEEKQFPFRREFTFDSQAPEFPWLFKDLKPTNDAKEVLAYGRKLLDLVKAQNIGGLHDEFALKLRDYSQAHFEGNVDNKAEFAKFMAADFFPLKPLTDIPDEQIVLTPWCEGRVWEIGRTSKEPFFCTEFNEDETRVQIPIFVAKVEDRFRVVR